MRQAHKKNEKDKVAIVLMLSFAVIALTSIFAVKANIDKINESKVELPVSEEAKVDSNSDKKVKQPDKEEVSAQIPTVDSLESPSKNSDYIYPVNAEKTTVTNPYSMDKLIYSLTLDQYMTHSGVDIEAPEDSQVVAVADGTITSVYNDDRYGLTIEISHPGNIVSVYQNLSTSEMVEIGDVVTQGQIIGGVGSAALFESMEPAHLHFAMTKNGAFVDPANYILF